MCKLVPSLSCACVQNMAHINQPGLMYKKGQSPTTLNTLGINWNVNCRCSHCVSVTDLHVTACGIGMGTYSISGIVSCSNTYILYYTIYTIVTFNYLVSFHPTKFNWYNSYLSLLRCHNDTMTRQNGLDLNCD